MVLVHSPSSKLRIGASWITDRRADRSQGRVPGLENSRLITVATVLKPGQKLRVIKFVSYGWSASGR